MVVPESPSGVVYEVHGPAEPGMQLSGAAPLPASPPGAAPLPASPPLLLLLLLQPPRAMPASASR